MLLHFDGYALSPVLELAIGRGDPGFTRACIAEDWLYVVVQGEGILAAPLPGLG